MLFHYGFYSNKHPSVPACSHARSVEAGEHHLSRVKFPTVADQSKLNILELFLRSLRLGLAATRANLVPAFLVQALMAGLVVSYFYLPAAKPIFGVLTDWNVHGGLLFSFVAMGITVGGLTEIFSVYLHKNGRWTGEDLENMVFNFLVFGFLGVMNSLFYQLQAHWFGAGRSPSILATKTFVDQFLYTPFLSNPMQTLTFLWKSEQFSFRILIYCFPTSLQLPLGILAVAIWSTLIAALVEPADSGSTFEVGTRSSD